MSHDLQKLLAVASAARGIIGLWKDGYTTLEASGDLARELREAVAALDETPEQRVARTGREWVDAVVTYGKLYGKAMPASSVVSEAHIQAINALPQEAS